MLLNRINYIFFFLSFFNVFSSQNKNDVSFQEIRKAYEYFEENDLEALHSINLYVKKAKSEMNYSKLVQGYKDGVYYSLKNEDKLAYADSTIWAANLSKDNDLISMAYLGKGIVYYFNYKKYQLALTEYIKAFNYSKKINDEYLKYKIIYHLGVVKSYLDYNDDAILHFQKCSNYFSFEMVNKNNHSNVIFNNKKGYLNSIHQMTECYLKLNKYKISDSLIDTGLKHIGNNNDFSQEKSYFFKCKGISYYYKKDYYKALFFLNKAIPRMLSNNNLGWASVTYFYIGKSYNAIDNEDMALKNFKKVDSIFQENLFIHTAIRQNFEELINYYKKYNDVEQELYYTKQILIADSIIARDFTYLSSKVHKEYDTHILLDGKKRLEKATIWNTIIIYSLILFVVVLSFILVIKESLEKNISEKHHLFEDKILHNQKESEKNINEEKFDCLKERKFKINDDKAQEILKKLEVFENKNQFNQKGLTLNKLAMKFETNTNYLSHVINVNKGCNFNRYLGELRIKYITEQIYNNKNYLNYTIESYAEECGIASRQNFSDLFYEINGIRPKDFINNRKRELD